MRRKLYQVPKVNKTIVQSFTKFNKNQESFIYYGTKLKRKLIRIKNWCLSIQDSKIFLEIPSTLYNDQYQYIISAMVKDKRSLLPKLKKRDQQCKNVVQLKLSCQCGYTYNSNSISSFEINQNIKLQDLCLIVYKLIEYLQLYNQVNDGFLTNLNSLKITKNSLLSRYCENCLKEQMWVEPPIPLEESDNFSLYQSIQQILNTMVQLIKEKNDNSLQFIKFLQNLQKKNFNQIKTELEEKIGENISQLSKVKPTNNKKNIPDIQLNKLKTERIQRDLLKQFQQKEISLEFKENYAYLDNFRKTESSKLKKSQTSRRRRSPFFQIAKEIPIKKSQLILPIKKIIYINKSHRQSKKNNFRDNVTLSQWNEIHQISTEVYSNYCNNVVKTVSNQNTQDKTNTKSLFTQQSKKQDSVQQFILKARQTLKEKIDPIGVGVNQITNVLQKYNLKWLYPLYFIYKKFFYMRCAYIAELLDSKYQNNEEFKKFISEISQQNKSVYNALTKMQRKIEKHPIKDQMKKIIQIEMQESDEIYSNFVSFMVLENVNLYESLFLKLKHIQNIQQLQILSVFGNIICLASYEEVNQSQEKRLLKSCINSHKYYKQKLPELLELQQKVLRKLKQNIQ